MNTYNPFEELKKELNTKDEILNQTISLAKKSKIKSNHPDKTNIISKNFRNIEIYGTIPENEFSKLNNDSYINQFELSKFDNNNKPLTINESNENEMKLNIEKNIQIENGFSPFDDELNMTYGLDNKLTHNNMTPYNKWRDKQIDNFNCDNNQVLIDRYSGSSRFYFQKKEVETFFDPKDTKNVRYDQNLVNDMNRNRYISSYMKQGEKPFETIKVNQGLNLKYDELSSSGFFDDYRPQYKNVDELRPLNKPKLSYSGFMIDGKKGEKRGYIATPTKYRPQTFKEISTNDYIPNSNITTKKYNEPNYQMKEQSRKSNIEEIGNVSLSYGTTNDNLLGKNKDFDRKLYNLNQQGNLSNNNVFNPNNNSYNIYDNQRNLSKQELNTFIKYVSTSYANLSDELKLTLRSILSNKEFNNNITPIQKQTISNFTDEAKQTLKQLLVLNELNTNIKNNNGIYSNLTDIAKETIKEVLTQKQFNTNLSSNNTTYVNLTDETKQTMRELLTLIEMNNNLSSNNTTYVNLTDIPQNTLKDVMINKQLNTNIQNLNNIYSNITDTPQITNRETLDKEFNTYLKNTTYTYSNITDNIKNNLRNILSQIPLNTYISSINKQNISNLTDETKQTLKQLLTLKELNTNIQNINKQNYINLDPSARETLRELITLLQFNNNLSSNNTVYSNQTDLPKNTLKQLFTQTEFNNNLSSNNTVYSNQTDLPKDTLKQLLTLKELNNNLSSNNTVYSNLTDKARETLKELLTQSEFNTNISNVNTIYSNLSDEARETLKQLSLIKDYIYLTSNHNGLYNNTFKNPDINLRNLINIDYQGPLGFNKESIKQLENVILNELKSQKGRTFNLAGPVINNDKPSENITLKEEINYSRFENGLLKGNNLNDRNYLKNIEFKNVNEFDEEYNKLKIQKYDTLDNNPLINSLNIKSKNVNDENTNEFIKNILGNKYI